MQFVYPTCKSEAGREAVYVLPRDVEGGVGHPQRLEDPLLEELAQSRPRHGLYHRPELDGDWEEFNAFNVPYLVVQTTELFIWSVARF